MATEFPPGPGGIGTHAHAVAVRCAESDWDVTVLTPQDYVPVAEAEAFDVEQPFAVVRFEGVGSFARQALSRARAASRLADHLAPDLVVASGTWAVWLTALAPGIRRRPCVSVGHGMEFGKANTTARVARRYAYGRATEVVCVSQYTCQRMREAGIRARDVTIIPNGGNSRVFRPKEGAKRSFLGGRFADSPLILTVGNISERKAQDIVVRALPTLVESGVDVHYVVAGLPTRGTPLADLARELGVEQRVHVVGLLSTPELVHAYQACDVFAMTSREASNGDFEGYGIAVMEAALCGKPAIVTSRSGLEEAVVDGQTGIVVPQNDPAAVAAAGLRLLTDEPLRVRLGDAARQRALEEGTWQHRGNEYVRLFEKIAGR